MRKLIGLTMFVAAIAAISFMSSCSKTATTDPGNLPQVTFLTGMSPIAGKVYISHDTALYDQDSMVVGLKCWKVEPPDVLKRFTIVRSESGLADVTVLDSTIPVASQDTFRLDFVNLVPSPTTGNTTRYQKWTFSVINRDGLIGKKSFTLQTL